LVPELCALFSAAEFPQEAAREMVASRIKVITSNALLPLKLLLSMVYLLSTMSRNIPLIDVMEKKLRIYEEIIRLV
jgi:hypothetical protein